MAQACRSDKSGLCQTPMEVVMVWASREPRQKSCLGCTEHITSGFHSWSNRLTRALWGQFLTQSVTLRLGLWSLHGTMSFSGTRKFYAEFDLVSWVGRQESCMVMSPKLLFQAWCFCLCFCMLRGKARVVSREYATILCSSSTSFFLLSYLLEKVVRSNVPLRSRMAGCFHIHFHKISPVSLGKSPNSLAFLHLAWVRSG